MIHHHLKSSKIFLESTLDKACLLDKDLRLVALNFPVGVRQKSFLSGKFDAKHSGKLYYNNIIIV